jgi:hypothetical protein
VAGFDSTGDSGRVKRDGSTVGSIKAHLGYWLRFVLNQVSHAFSRKFAAGDATVAERVIFREVFENDGMLADKLGMIRGAISKLADRLVAKELAAQTLDQHDRRYQALALADRKNCDPKLFGFYPKEQRSVPSFDVDRGAHTKRKFKYGKEPSPRGLECECTQEERSTSITKQLVFQYPFCRKTSCNRVLERFLLVE